MAQRKKKVDKERAKDTAQAIDAMIAQYESMPGHAILLPVTQTDILGLLYLLRAICSCIEES